MEDYNALEYNANQGKLDRISRYKKLLGLEEDFKITEDNIDDYGVNWISCYYNCPADRVRSELLGQRWSEYEN